jgi:hypothetical protein
MAEVGIMEAFAISECKPRIVRFTDHDEVVETTVAQIREATRRS